MSHDGGGVIQRPPPPMQDRAAQVKVTVAVYYQSEGDEVSVGEVTRTSSMPVLSVRRY